MKISPDSFLRISNQPIKDFKSFLFYGSSEFFVQWKIEHFFKKNPAFVQLETRVISQDSLLEKDTSLSSLLLTQDFFTGPQVTIIAHATDKITSLIEQALESSSSLPFFFIKAQDYLKPTSKLRKLYESHAELGSIACYELTPAELEKEITSFFTQHQKKIPSELAQRMGLFFHSSPELLKPELEKILLYMGPQEVVDPSDIKKIMCLSTSGDTADLVNAFLNKNKKALINSIENLEETSSYISVLRALGASLLRLHQVKSQMEKQKSFERAIQELSPPLLFTEHALFRKRLSLWSHPALENALKKMSETEIILKLNSRMTKEIFEFSLLETLLLV